MVIGRKYKKEGAVFVDSTKQNAIGKSLSEIWRKKNKEFAKSTLSPFGHPMNPQCQLDRQPRFGVVQIQATDLGDAF